MNTLTFWQGLFDFEKRAKFLKKTEAIWIDWESKIFVKWKWAIDYE